MLIKPNNKYRIISIGPDKLKYEWNLHIIPEKRAWNLANTQLSAGEHLNEYRVVEIEEVEDSTTNDIPKINRRNNDNTVKYDPVLSHVHSIHGNTSKNNVTSNICPTCQGKKEMRCRTCDGISSDLCKRCNGTGKTYCNECRGEGRLSNRSNLGFRPDT